MSIMEKISDILKHNEDKKLGIQKALLMLMIEWKDFEGHLDLTHKCFHEGFNELNSREERVNSFHQSAIESAEKLGLIQKSVETQQREAEKKEKEVIKFVEERFRILEVKEKQLDLIQKEREEKLNEQKKQMGVLLEQMNSKHEEIAGIQGMIDRSFKEVGQKEKQLEERTKELNLIQDRINKREEQLSSLRMELELKEKELDSSRTQNQQHTKELDLREKQIDTVKKFTHDFFKDLHSQLDKELLKERSKKLDLREKQLEDRYRDLEFREKCIADWAEEISLKEYHKELELQTRKKATAERFNELELKEEIFGNLLDANEKGTERVKSSEAIHSADIESDLKNDGKSLQIFLNKHGDNLDSISVRVLETLRSSLNPAKLVLDAMDGFYPHLKKGNREFEINVVQRSCVFLLEQLLQISPQIQPSVREEALKLAGEWKLKVRAQRSSNEILGFLYLLASYGLASDFTSEEILNFLEGITYLKETPYLCLRLGVKIHDLIQSLIRKEEWIPAFDFIHEVGLVHAFESVSLLKSYVSSRTPSRNQGTPDSLSLQIDIEISILREVLGRITRHGLENEWSPNELRLRIHKLEAEKQENLTSSMQISGCNPEQGQTASPSKSSQVDPQQQQKREKRPHSDENQPQCPSSTERNG